MKVMATKKKRRIEDRFPHIESIKGNTPMKEKGYCNHCRKDGHNEATYWDLHPYLRPKRNKKTRQTPPRETTNHAVLQGNSPLGGNQLPKKGQLGKDDMFGIMTEGMGKIL